MPSLDSFTHLGIYVDKEFLDEQLCETLCSEMQSGKLEPADVIVDEAPLGRVDLEVRKVHESHVSSPATFEVVEKLRSLKPKLETHFGLTLTDCEDIQFLFYQPGDFFLPHQDTGDYPGKSGNASKRQVSVVIFLNSSGDAALPGTYSGGALHLYGVLPGKMWEKCGLPVVANEGSLVAFRSEIIHEVQPVLQGFRYTIVSWYY